MLEKYRFDFSKEDADICDDMLWVFPNVIIGITKTKDHYKINHYGKEIDKKNYIKVDMSYNFDNLLRDWITWFVDYSEEIENYESNTQILHKN